jgi:hypothetical protein
MGTSSLLIWSTSGVPDTQDIWGLQQEMRERGGWGDITGESRRTEVSDADGPTRLSKVEAVSVVQGVEQGCAGDWEGVAGEREGQIPHTSRKQAVTASIANQVAMRPFHNWEIRRWTLQPKGFIKQAC